MKYRGIIIWGLSLILILVGQLSLMLYIKVSGLTWWHYVLLFISTVLLMVPALYYWKDKIGKKLY